MKKLFLLTTLLFGLLMVGCSEDNAGTQAGNTAGFGGDNPALSINADYTGGRNVTFSVSYFGNQVTDEAYKVQWDFGDAATGANNTASTAVAPHTFSENESGEFTVVVNVDNADGTAVGKSTKTVIVRNGGKVGEVDIQVTDTEDPLTKQFTTKAESDSGVPVRITWDFEGTKIVAPNNTTHTFSKYNKTYTVSATAKDMVSGKSNSGTKEVTIPAGLSIQCTQANRVVSCTPNLTGVPGGLTDAVYVWYFNKDNPADNITTAGNDAAVYTYADGGPKTVSVSLTSAKIEGELKATTTVDVATNIAMDPIVCDERGLLEYSCSVNASLVDGKTDTITYKWSSEATTDVAITNDTTNNATFKFKKFPSALNPSYLVKVVASNNNDKASQSTRIEIEHPTVTISQAAGDNTIVNLNASLSKNIDGVQYNWTITAPDGTSAGKPTGPSVEVNLTQSGTYTAEVEAIHESFADKLQAKTTIVNTGVIKNAVINCSPVSTGMEYVCNTDAYAVGENNQAVPLKYQWNITRGDKGETYTFDTKNFTQKFKRYNGTYYVNLVLIAEGSEVAVSAPQKVIVTPNLTLNYTASATSVKQGEKVTFTAKLEGELEGVPVENPTFTWYDGSKKVEGNTSNTYVFSSTATLRQYIKVEVSSPSLGVPLSGVKTVDVYPDTLKPSDIQNLVIKCPQDGTGLDTAKRKCTVTFNNTNNNQQGAKIYLVPKGVNGQPDGTPVAFSSGDQKTVVFDWPHLNIANIQNYNDMPTFTAKLGVQLYDAKGKKVADIREESYTIKYPQVYYEMAHNVDGEYIKEGSRFFGTDAKLTFTKKLNSTLPMNANVEWFMNFNGKSGTVSKTFSVNSDGQTVDFTTEMRKARFAGIVDGDPFVGENGFGVKISGNGLSKPLYLYGVNTYVGKQSDEKALGKFLNGRSWISPKVEVGFVGGHGKNSITGGFMVPIHIVFADKANLDATGWDHLCVIGVDGTAWHNNNKNNKHRYALPKALILPQANSPFTSNGYSKKGSYYTVLGTQWDHEYGFTEERTTGVTPGQPSIPYQVGGESLKYYPKGTFVEFKYFGFNGVHLGYMTKSGDLGSCVFARYAINNHKDKRFTQNPKEYIPNNKIPNN